MPRFFENIPGFKEPLGVSRPENYFEVPGNWHVLLCDIRSSTKAIQEGRYRDINLVGVSSITAVLNACGGADIPYVFGGDGATFVVPEHHREAAVESLKATREMAQKQFGLDLRVGWVSHADLQKAGETLRVGKYQASADTGLAVFSGAALTLAESWVKDPEKASLHLVEGSAADPGNYTGLECRWQPLPSVRGEILSVIIRARSKDAAQVQDVYDRLMPELDRILALSDRGFSPVRKANLKAEKNIRRLLSEARIKAHPGRVTLKSLLRLAWETLFCLCVFAFEVKVAGIHWRKYKEELIRNSDYWKYDEMIRFVADVNPGQKSSLMELLEKFRGDGRIYFGVHSSESALMTCLVQNRKGKHVHFIDGSDGGYSAAAVQLKEQMRRL